MYRPSVIYFNVSIKSYNPLKYNNFIVKFIAIYATIYGSWPTGGAGETR